MKITSVTLLLSLAIVPTARADTPSEFCASLAFGIEVYEGLDQARAIRTSTRGVPCRTRGTAHRDQETTESGLAAAAGAAFTGAAPGSAHQTLQRWNQQPVTQSQIAAQDQQDRLTRARLLVHEMQDAYLAELQRYEKYTTRSRTVSQLA